MTSRSRLYFWTLSGVLALIIAFMWAITAYRWSLLQATLDDLRSRCVYVTFEFQGPDWFEPLLPEIVTEVWLSDVYITHETDTMVMFDDEDWRNAAPLLRQLPNLTMIRFEGFSPSSESIASLERFSNLRRLEMDRTYLRDEQFIALSRCHQLEELVVIQDVLSESGMESISKLYNLRFLNLYRTKVVENGLRYVRDMPNLRFCGVFDSGLSDNALLSLAKDMPELFVTRYDGKGLLNIR